MTIDGIPTAGLSPNDITTLVTLMNTGAQGQALLNLIGGLDAENRKFTLDILSGQNNALALQLALDAPREFIDTIENHVLVGSGTGGAQHAAAGQSDTDQAGLLDDDAPRHGSLWARAFGVFGGASGVSNVSPFDLRRAGVIAGADARVAQGLVLGAAFDYAHDGVTFTDGSGSMALARYTGGVYAGWRGGPWYASAIGEAGWNEFQTQRNLPLGLLPASASFNGLTYSIYGETGYVAQIDSTSLRPYLGLRYVHAHIDGFTESGGGASLIVDGSNASSVTTDLGLRISTTLQASNGSVVPALRAAWEHEYANPAPQLTQAFVMAPDQPFTIAGANFGRDSALIGAGLTSNIGDSISVFFDYDGHLNGSFSEHAISAGFKVKF